MPPLEVVCGLIFQHGRVLATRRDPKRAYGLKWEFPGGKLEEKESPREALLRELVEELDFKVRIIEQLDPVSFSENDFELILMPFLCVPGQDFAPRPIDHTEIRWILPEEAGSLVWAPADLPLVKILPDIGNIH